jgi:3-methyladenine DNA glycosylase AlkD
VTALATLRRELAAAAEPSRVPELQRFFKTGPGGYGEGDVFIGVRVPAARAVASRYLELDLDDLVELLASAVHEERLVALLILVRQYERGGESTRGRTYDCYLGNTRHVNNWDLVDLSAPPIVGAHLLARPRAVLDRLARSPSVWERRIAIVSSFAFIRAGEYEDTLRLARALLCDEHELVQKAVGWMLREIGKRDEPALVGFLERHAHEMPRTMLRYAVERLEPEIRTAFMGARRARRT